VFRSPTPPPPPPSLPLLVLLIVASHIASSTATPLIFDCCVHLIVVAVVVILLSSLHPHLVVNVSPFVMSSDGPSCVPSIYSHAAAAGVAVAVTVAVRRQMQFRRRCKGLCVMPGYIFLLWQPPRLLPPPQRAQRQSKDPPFLTMLMCFFAFCGVGVIFGVCKLT
jgi:hypothetical protein